MIVAPRLLRRRGVPGVAVLLALTGVWAAIDVNAQFSSSTDLVEVYVSVTDRDGRPVQDLTREEFAVTEDGVPRPVTVFSAGDLPLSLAVVVDHSFSMAGRPLAAALAGADRLVATMEPSDGVAVVTLGSGVTTLAPFGTPATAARQALARVRPWGTTPLGESVEAALGALDGRGGRRAVVLFTDGRGRYDPADRPSLVERVRRTDVLVYPVFVSRGPASPLLMELASLSGGRTARIGSTAEADRTSAALSTELRHQYLLGYEPPPGGDREAGWHAIGVSVSRARVTVRARAGYYRPDGPRQESARPPHASKLTKDVRTR